VYGAQAIDRCHRLGQTRDVVVTKLITAHHRAGGETVEQRMLGIQVPRSCCHAQTAKRCHVGGASADVVLSNELRVTMRQSLDFPLSWNGGWFV
jgi:hypothetical protein